MNRRYFLPGKIAWVLACGLLLFAVIGQSVADVSAGRQGILQDPLPTDTPSPTPTATATPVTGLNYTGWYKGCTSGPYITCSANVTSVQTDPYRWDFDITYTYNDNRTNMGSYFTLTLVFDTGVFYTGVPIWWEMYPITNEVMPNRWIDMQYSGVPDLNPMAYPTGSWTLPGQPIPYDTFRIRFSRSTGTTERLVRTDSWHVTVATYDYRALTPTPTPTATLTNTPTETPTATLTLIPTIAPPTGYLGSGYFPTNNLNRCHQGSGYADQTQNASARWSADTDLNMYYSCTNTHITTIYANFGDTGWVGKAHICSTNNDCDNDAAYNDTYASCEVWLNEREIAVNPFYTDAEVQKLATHELGHCYSLAHSSDSTSVMGNGSVPNAQDIFLINARY